VSEFLPLLNIFIMIGREEEEIIVNKLFTTQKSELLLVMGRRRVGKTYFIEHVFNDTLTFHFIGTKDAETENQLSKFKEKISKYFKKNDIEINIEKWASAFNYLSNCLSALRKSKKKKVIFFDEFPWIDSHKSNFLNEFSYWWNDWAVKQNIIVVIAGSATSYLIDNFEDSEGGLHNRVTQKINLQPFTLQEVKIFFQKKNIYLDDYNIIQLYMAMGGIPHYLENVEKGESATQAINRMCFRKSGILKNEFDNLYKALFKHPENYISIIKALSSKHKGLTRQEIVQYTGLSDGGGLTKLLKELEACSFIIKLDTLEKKSKDILYKLIDEYSLFYFNFIENRRTTARDAWLHYSKSQSFSVWQGYAFENLCFRHINAIKEALGISGIYSENASFYYKGSKAKTGFQIDMIINRSDHVMNICEMKFYNKEVTVDRVMADKLRIRRATFAELSKTKKLLLNTLITSYGCESNEHSLSQIDNVVTMQDFFRLKKFD
jgi:uncharacterized protein